MARGALPTPSNQILIFGLILFQRPDIEILNELRDGKERRDRLVEQIEKETDEMEEILKLVGNGDSRVHQFVCSKCPGKSGKGCT